MMLRECDTCIVVRSIYIGANDCVNGERERGGEIKVHASYVLHVTCDEVDDELLREGETGKC